MLEQIDHRGKRFTIDDEDIDDAAVACCRRAEVLERKVQREIRERERAKAVAGPTSANPDVEVLEQ
ncbi:hypothetical protein [Halomontanus rarus]|uniref:hypothetical protein n=1 Tax=Halomontanus rarus TaxID=3034020 RepID=UPI00293B92B1|nr:hypothetical protein [Halovivax sp. KZCA124]